LVAFLAEPPASRTDLKEFNLYQVVLVAIVSYLAFRLISFLFLNSLDTPPE
jgi:hypothetical protein